MYLQGISIDVNNCHPGVLKLTIDTAVETLHYYCCILGIDLMYSAQENVVEWFVMAFCASIEASMLNVTL